MKKYILLIGICILSLVIYSFVFSEYNINSYDKKYIKISTVTDKKGYPYTIVELKRADNRVKAKYFAAKENGNTVYQRYSNWSRGKNIILISSGTYMNDAYQPDGLTIDNGKLVNNALSDKFDALVIVYATGGIAVSDLDEGNLKIECNNTTKTFDIRKNALHRQSFIECAKSVEATVFQTHLLIYKNRLRISQGKTENEKAERERRFLAVGRDEANNIVHVIVHSPTATTLYDGTRRVYDFLINFKDMQEIVFMINLDTGYQDIFRLYDYNGKERGDIRGPEEPSKAVNILTYYYE